MAHTVAEKQKLLRRVRRLKGQLQAIDTAVAADADAAAILTLVTSCRGSINSLMAEVLEDHIRLHVLPEHPPPSESVSTAADELIEIMHAYVGA